MLIELLFGRYRQKVLSLLLLHPESSFHVRELARQTGTSAGTLHKELSKLAQAGLLLREAQGNQVRYRANQGCPVFPELAGLFRKTTGLVDVLREALAPLAGQLELVRVFGSVARGEEQPGSDVDLLLVGSASFGEVVRALYPAQQTLQREINPVLYAPADWQAQQAAAAPLVRELLEKPTLWVMGNSDDFGQSAGDPQAATL